MIFYLGVGSSSGHVPLRFLYAPCGEALPKAKTDEACHDLPLGLFQKKLNMLEEHHARPLDEEGRHSLTSNHFARTHFNIPFITHMRTTTLLLLGFLLQSGLTLPAFAGKPSVVRPGSPLDLNQFLPSASPSPTASPTAKPSTDPSEVCSCDWVKHHFTLTEIQTRLLSKDPAQQEEGIGKMMEFLDEHHPLSDQEVFDVMRLLAIIFRTNTGPTYFQQPLIGHLKRMITSDLKLSDAYIGNLANLACGIGNSLIFCNNPDRLILTDSLLSVLQASAEKLQDAHEGILRTLGDAAENALHCEQDISSHTRSNTRLQQSLINHILDLRAAEFDYLLLEYDAGDWELTDNLKRIARSLINIQKHCTDADTKLKLKKLYDSLSANQISQVMTVLS